MESPFISGDARGNRAVVTESFDQAGFYPYPFEFWHYSRDDVYGALLGRSPGAVPYGPVDVDVDSGMVRPVDQPVREIVPRDELLDILVDRLAAAKLGENNGPQR